MKFYKKQLTVTYPMGGLRKMDYMRGIPRHLITYCQYGFTYRKATDIWTNHPQPEFLPPCRNGDPCHQPALRGTFELSRQTGLRRKPKGRLSESRRTDAKPSAIMLA